MAICQVCGNDYARTFEITMDGKTHVFDSFECAISALAPYCQHCGCRIVGHGVDDNEGRFYCCSHCARQGGTQTLKANQGR